MVLREFGDELDEGCAGEEEVKASVSVSDSDIRWLMGSQGDSGRRAGPLSGFGCR